MPRFGFWKRIEQLIWTASTPAQRALFMVMGLQLSRIMIFLTLHICILDFGKSLKKLQNQFKKMLYALFFQDKWRSGKCIEIDVQTMLKWADQHYLRKDSMPCLILIKIILAILCKDFQILTIKNFMNLHFMKTFMTKKRGLYIFSNTYQKCLTYSTM